MNLTKPHTKAVVAVARELAGFIWATLCRPGIADQREEKRAVRSRTPRIVSGVKVLEV